MKSSSSMITYFLTMLFCLSMASSTGHALPQEPEAVNDSKIRAQELWEKALAAKGGRERLRWIDNILKIENVRYWASLFKRGRFHRVSLAVFPGKSWLWVDYRPGVLGLRVTTFNAEEDFHWAVHSSHPNSLSKVDMSKHPIDPVFPRLHLIEMLETQWYSPVPYKAETGKIGFTTYNIVYVKAERRWAKYFLDTKTFLPRRVEIYSSPESQYPSTYDFFDYIEVDGIMVPSKIRRSGKKKIPIKYFFNVEYDPELFTTPPSIEAGPDAWKPKGEKQ